MANTVDAFFDSLASLSSDPADPSLRSGAIDAASMMVTAVNNTADSIQRTIDSSVEALGDYVEVIQALADEIASINGLVAIEGSDTVGVGDYLDRRDTLIAQLSEYVGVTADLGSDGQATVFLGGHAVIMGTTAREFTYSLDSTGSPKITISVDSGTINVTEFVGGKVGGVLSAVSSMDSYLSYLDVFVEDLSIAFNSQHNLGFDQSGAAGGDFFSYSSGNPGDAARSWEILDVFEDDETLLALAGAIPVSAGDGDNLVLLYDVGSADLFDGATQSTTEYIAGLYSMVGSDIVAAEMAASTATAELQDYLSLRDSLQGVDLDEEAIQLITYQAAYQASAKVVAAANETLDQLMAII